MLYTDLVRAAGIRVGPGSEAGSGSKWVYLSLPKYLGFGADALQDSRCRAARICHERGAGLSPCARNTIREAMESEDLPPEEWLAESLR